MKTPEGWLWGNLMYDRYELPRLLDMAVRDVYLAVLFQLIFWKRQAEKAATLRLLRDAGLGNENAAYKHYTSVVNMLFAGGEEERALDTKKAAEIMKEESKKAYIVSPIAFRGLKIRRRDYGSTTALKKGGS